ncbi:hypothetical protein [Nonomuraea sp. NPDC049695]|uniref:hypothetical protein n=1 Tax=Nonomuraea sp. NPDC049695 TaxID=3154734 RepID=UPI00341DA4A4
MAGADLLGTMLARHPRSVTQALSEWEQQLRPSIGYLQGNGMQMRSLFVPASPGPPAYTHEGRWPDRAVGMDGRPGFARRLLGVDHGLTPSGPIQHSFTIRLVKGCFG